MNKFLIRLISIFLFSHYFLRIGEVKALIPYYYLPTIKNLKKESLSIGKKAYQLLYFGQIKESLSLSKLAVRVNESNEKLWLILSEAQIANELYDDALISLKKAQNINPKMSELYFSQSSIYLKKSNLKEAKKTLKTGLTIEPKNHRGIFQLGNIYLMEKNYLLAIKTFDKALKINPDFWQAINNQALAYFEEGKIDISLAFFEKAISIEENAEPLLGLAACLRLKNINSALLLAKKALKKDPNYVQFEYREEQLWGEKLQSSTEKLFEIKELQKDIELAKTKINKNS